MSHHTPTVKEKMLFLYVLSSVLILDTITALNSWKLRFSVFYVKKCA
jgi:hypothetical protein